MTAPDPGAYLLSPEESQQIFHEHIVPTMLAEAAPQREPVMILLTAQPGAGKSVLARDIRATFPDGARPVIIDVDSFRPFYPGYRDLHKEWGWTADDLVQADARRWLDQSVAYLAEHRANAIVEHGLRDRHVTDALLNRFASAQPHPFRIEAAILAVSAAESRLGMLERYQLGHEQAGLGRYVAEEVHDHRYRHILDVADWLEADPRVSAATVYRRGSTSPVFRNERGRDGRWSQQPSLRQIIESQRRRPWSLEESKGFLRLYHSLTARTAPEWRPALKRISDAAEPLLHESAGIPSHDTPAVTFGRYQIVSIAHLDTIRTILLDWPTVEVGVLDLDPRPAHPPNVPAHLRDFYQGCEANTSSAKNPMTAEERAGFWRATIAEAGLEDRVTVRVIPRPELFPQGFNKQYPPDQFDLVFPTARGEGFDLIRNASFEEILRRPVHPVDPPLEYHTSDIRAAYRAGNEAWRNGFAPGGLQAFIAADGPRRLLGEPAPGTVAPAQKAHAAMHAFPSPPSPKSKPGRQTPPPPRPANSPRRAPGRGTS